MSDIHISKNGNFLDPRMYWAVLAREALEDYNKRKKSNSTLMRHLLNSASYGFNPSRFAIGMIYANGSNGFKTDLPRAYAWLVIAAKRKNKTIISQRDRIQKILSQEELLRANKIIVKIKKRYGKDAAFRKFQKWVEVESAVTGSKVKGNHSYLNVQIVIAGIGSISSDELAKRLNKLYELQLINIDYEVNPQKIKTVN